MRLLVLNGSPRPARSNTGILIRHFEEGFLSSADHQSVTLELVRQKYRSEALARFFEFDAVLLAFPLSIDAMPSVVKEFIEALGELPFPAVRPKLLFLVQSGFPEATHTEAVARYLGRLAERLGCANLGVIRRGGVEGIQRAPAFRTRALYRKFRLLGAQFGRTGELDPRRLDALAGPMRIPKVLLQLAAWFDTSSSNRILKKNGAFGTRFAAPYAVDAATPHSPSRP